jgi:hypothetical protein
LGWKTSAFSQPHLHWVRNFSFQSAGRSVLITGAESYISEAKIILGRDEWTEDRFSMMSTAIWALLTMTIVWPKTVIELIGPGVEWIYR